MFMVFGTINVINNQKTMKNKTLVVISMLSLVIGLIGSQVFHTPTALARDSRGEEVEDSVSENNSKSIENQKNPTSTRIEDDQDQEDNNDINDDEGDNGKEHLDQVEKITHTLEEVSKKHNDIDDDLNDVIKEMASSSKEASKAIDDLDNEGSVKKFFFGPDFDSLGELRSTIVTTQNHIDRLTKAQEKVTDPAAKATLEAQITALKDVASSTQQFVNTHEHVFSLFGWFVKMFSNE